MFSVFRGTKYDDIRPNHTKKNNQNNQKPTHMVFDFLWTRQGTFLVPQFHSPNGAKNLWFRNFPHTVTCLWGVENCKTTIFLHRFGCGTVGLLVNFLAGQENHPTFNIYGQLWPWWGVGVVEKMVKPQFGIGQGNVWWVWWGCGHYWPRN